MKKFKTSYYLTTMMFLVFMSFIVTVAFEKDKTISGLATIEAAGTPAMPAIILKPAFDTVALGDQIRVDILASGISNVTGIQINVRYNSSVLSYARAVEGDFLKSGSTQTIFLDTIKTAESGLIKDIAIVRIGSSASGNGVIASIYFNALSIGNSYISLDKKLVADINSNLLSANAVNAKMFVVNFIDSDNDGVPDSRDKCVTPPSQIVNRYGCPFPVSDGFSSDLTTNFTDVDLTRLRNLKIGVANLGQVDFENQEIRLIENISGNIRPVNLTKIIEFQPRKVVVRSELFAELNKTAKITLMNIVGIINPIVKVGGILCTRCRILSFNSGVIVFTVPHFSEYSVEEGYYCGDAYCSTQEGCSSCSNDCGSCPSPSSSGSSSGSRGSSGGSSGVGGGSAFYVCNMDWQCSEWENCVDGMQTRKCTFVKVPQHSQKEICQQEAYKPYITQQCALIESLKPIEKPKAQEPVKTQEEIKVIIEEKSNRFGFAIIVAAFAFVFIVLIGAGVFEIKHYDRNKPVSHDEGVLIPYLRVMRRQGKDDSEIKKSLIDSGWDKDFVEEVIKKNKNS